MERQRSSKEKERKMIECDVRTKEIECEVLQQKV